jgi:hypothetical protein
MNPEHEKYIRALEASLVRAKLDGVQIQAVLAQFIVDAEKTNPARAMVEAVESYGNEDGYLLLQSIAEEKSKIQEALEKIEKENPYKILTPRERIQRDIEKIKRNSFEWEFVLSDQDRKNLTPNQLAALEKAELARKNPKPVEIPSCFASTTQFEGRPIVMELEVIKR